MEAIRGDRVRRQQGRPRSPLLAGRGDNTAIGTRSTQVKASGCSGASIGGGTASTRRSPVSCQPATIAPSRRQLAQLCQFVCLERRRPRTKDMAPTRKLLKFLILFDNTNLLYFPGQFLSGRVLVELDEDTPALGLHFHVVGEGVIRLRSRRQERVFDKENYIDFRMRLLGEPGQGPALLSPGIHSFPFKLGLPLGLPSTFLGKHGWVQYFCKAALREPNGLTHKNQQVFVVMNPVDLNLEPPGLASPLRCEVEHRLGVACVSPGAVEVRVTLDRGGYVPGETIGISATVANRSRVTIKSTRAALTETIQYVARGRVVQTETRELGALTRGRVKPGETDTWDREQLYVPPLPPTNLRGCHLVRVSYDVFFVLQPKGLEKRVKLQLPIVLATYPLRAEEGNPAGGKAGTHYPSTLPIFRAWLDEKPVEQ